METSMSGEPELSYAVSERIAEISLARPPVNALSLPLLDAIIAALRRATADDGVRAVILTSAVPGRFSAGLDLDLILGRSGPEVRRFLDKLYGELAEVQFSLGKPSIAAVNGAARGGGMTLAISCDVLLAARGATFGYPEIDLALPPAIHFSHLPRIVGRHRAFELLFSGRAFAAEEALSLGLVSRVVADAELRDAARALARTFARKSPAAMRLARSAFLRANDRRDSVADAIEVFCDAVATDAAQEGLRAFVEKRKPKW
jgi:enoyl-CoA hydratase